ncbi:hypothetical protein RhiirA1_466488 [Rhizophagus irregularis]|uniref:Uncharacterized protein n=2 Tax=Rhizophagus irregularis TaxID=588596 RepID=U9TD80_RHIID|nr:hypothetical protein GLOIN_2v1778683 [Rhizophagus irregularis DAOM 181602=DAOM 197198]PKC61480.1 hypothetical protein RhiirA1_466488 [Rhizophagus irregularis]POG68089.1 hypothetical protein GLOIN_2v1778683 [Rhizophagus irregularis DAOM 181602=DAOM 197198]GBC29783.1 hypothetical protein GLOIN_2v1778683 [Rhizophagus irregularis DAOM 181602=DAOM 197198]|eukprot:XP_025174955.1 hypothetical protein GLOIN_2v1778683 [Rhizophagus irregularis DAOM 181602=DAOM 197198]
MYDFTSGSVGRSFFGIEILTKSLTSYFFGFYFSYSFDFPFEWIGIHCPNSSNSFNTINTHTSSLFSVIGFIFKCNSVEAAVVDFAEVTNANSSEVDAGFEDEVAPT